MPSVESLSEKIRNLYDIVDTLEKDWKDYPSHFTLDGNLLGSMGEVYAAEVYGIDLLRPGVKGHDGTKVIDGEERSIQIKTTQWRAKNQVVGISSEPEWLLVLQIDDEGNFTTVYNGRGEKVWLEVKDKATYTKQKHISLKRLRELDAEVPDEERI